MSIRETLITHFKEFKLLEEEESKKDPETDPYRSKYKAIKILLEDVDTAKKYVEQTDATDPDHEFCEMYLVLILRRLGMAYVDTEEFSEGIKYLMKSLDHIQKPVDPSFVWLSAAVRNDLGYAWLCRSEPEEALKFLKEAEKLYSDFTSCVQHMEAKHLIWDSLEEESLEETHTITKFYLAQAYCALKDSLRAAVYCHESLKRQLKEASFRPICWVDNCVKLSAFFVEKELYKQGRHHLAAASHVLDKYEVSVKNNEVSQEEIDAGKEELRHTSAELSWSWGKFGLLILQHSRYKVSDSKDETIDENHEAVNNLYFDGLELTSYENQLADLDVKTFEAAREVFLTSQRHLNKAKEYYTLEDRAPSHVQIVRDHSSLLSQLSAFESDEERKFKMLKKRADLLEVVLKELNPRYYLDFCRQLWFELGEVYQDMMQIKYPKMEKSPSRQIVKKINSLIDSSAQNFNSFLDSTKDPKTGKLPDPIEEDLIESILSAHFYLGRLYFKYITPDKRVQAEKLKKALEYFNYLVEKCDKSEETKALAGEKYQLSQEIVQLLQIKILRLQLSFTL